MLYHSSEKPHVCNECGRAFKELSTLHNHERIHSGERPFACETCGAFFLHKKKDKLKQLFRFFFQENVSDNVFLIWSIEESTRE